MNDDIERAEILNQVAKRLGVSFTNFMLLDRALTHASMACEQDGPVSDYESLEFLGDAALSLAVAHTLFERAPGRTPGEYSRMRASVVSSRGLERVARRLALADAIRLGKGEEQAGGRNRSGLLEDCLEAVIGAVYLDQGWDAAQAFVQRVFEPELEDAIDSAGSWDYKSRLQHHCQALRIELPEFVLIRSEGPDHCKEFEVEVLLRGVPMGRGVGSSKKEAEQRAAREALQREQNCGETK